MASLKEIVRDCITTVTAQNTTPEDQPLLRHKDPLITEPETAAFASPHLPSVHPAGETGVETYPSTTQLHGRYKTSPQTQRAIDSIVQIMLDGEAARADNSEVPCSSYNQRLAWEARHSETPVSEVVRPNCCKVPDIDFLDNTVNRLIQLSRKTWPMVSEILVSPQDGIPSQGQPVVGGVALKARDHLCAAESQFWAPDDYVKETTEATERLKELLT